LLKTGKQYSVQSTIPASFKTNNCVYDMTAISANTVGRKRTNGFTIKHCNTKTGMTPAMNKRAPLTFKIGNTAQVPAESKETSLPVNTKTRKRAKDEAKPGRDGRQFIAAHVPPEAAKQFKLLGVQQDKKTQDLLIEAINDLFAKYGQSRIA
jgi:hypothetical protein